MSCSLFEAFCVLQLARGAYRAEDTVLVTNHAYTLIIAGPVLWLLGSIHNAFQVYEKTDVRIQFMQKAVSIPFLIATTLLVVSGILSYQDWPLPPAAIKARVCLHLGA